VHGLRLEALWHSGPYPLGTHLEAVQLREQLEALCCTCLLNPKFKPWAHLESVQLREQLVQRLVALLVEAQAPLAACAPAVADQRVWQHSVV
jgi:hypothetical protein